MINENNPEQYDAMWIPEEPDTDRRPPWEADALWTPEFEAVMENAWEATRNRVMQKTLEIKSQPLSFLAESILEAQWILCTPLEAIQYALDEHIDSMIETGHSIYRDELDNPVGHSEFVAALSEIVQFFVAHEAK